MKKTISLLLLAALLTASLAGCKSKSEAKAPENNYEYEYDEDEASPASDFSYQENEEGGITITRYKGEDADVVIPKTIDGKKVTEIRGAFYGSPVETVVLSREINTIGGQSFWKCGNLKSVTLSPNLETIEYEAFLECGALKDVDLPSSLKEIGYQAFSGCTALEYIFIPKSITEWEGGCTFYNSGLKKVDIEEGMTVLGDMALARTQITEISFPDSLKTVPGGLCNGCEQLTKVTLHDKIETIEDGAFIGTGLTEIVIPASVKTVTDLAFSSNDHLQKVTFMGDAPEDYVDDEYNFQLGRGGGEYTVYYQKDAKGFTTPRWNGFKAAPVGSEPNAPVEGDFEYAVNADDTVTVVSYEGDDTEVVVPEKIAGKTVTVIGEKAFAYEGSITSVKLPDTVTEIGFGAFAQCFAVTSVNLPENLQMIGDYAFSSCHDLEEINLPAALRKIGTYAFSNCQEVEYLRIPATVTEIGEYAFMGLGYTNKGWSKGEFELELEEGIEVIGNWFYGTSMESVVLPSTVKRIEAGAFSGCDYLSSITLNEGLVSIGDLAFERCSSLTEIVIPSTVTEMSVLTFHYCTKLQAVKFEGNAPASFWKEHPDGDEVRPAYDVYRHQEATGFDADDFGWFDIQIW
ncbi:MAG: leucine-rich repeat domain-containing protein [Clostridia bacterium]|nr:leucine-rich repeat domain-containing protein [Clostridia bacterium]